MIRLPSTCTRHSLANTFVSICLSVQPRRCILSCRRFKPILRGKWLISASNVSFEHERRLLIRLWIKLQVTSPFVELLDPRISTRERQSDPFSVEFSDAQRIFTRLGLGIFTLHEQVQRRLPVNQDVIILLDRVEDVLGDGVCVKRWHLVQLCKLELTWKLESQLWSAQVKLGSPGGPQCRHEIRLQKYLNQCQWQPCLTLSRFSISL